MILINLLPQEYRQRRRTPIKQTVAVFAAVAVNCSLVAWWAWTAFGVSAEVQSEVAVLQDTLDSISPQVAYHRALEKENQQFATRETTLASITSNRISWTRKVDELIDIINRGGDGEKYLIWLDDLTVSQNNDPRRPGAGSLSAGGHSGSSNFAHVANFIDDLEASTFIGDFYKPEPPEGSQSSVDEELIPAEVWSFPLELALRPPEERERPQEEVTE